MTSIRRFVTGGFAVAVLLGSGTPPRAVAAEAECCWLYCETYRDMCQFLSDLDPQYCDAWYQGCIDGCQFSKGPPPPTF